MKTDIKNSIMDKSQADPNSGCWLWTASLSHDGYPQIRAHGQMRRAHRVSYEAFVGQIPRDMLVCHKCDTPTCVNSGHLFLGTQRENLADARNKNRLYKKLNNAAVSEIRNDIVSGVPAKAIAAKFSVSPALIWHIKRDKFKLAA